MGALKTFRYTEFMNFQKIAVIGSGISGLSAAYLLNKKYDVTLFESSDRLGGHTNTIQTSTGYNYTGFIVFNKKLPKLL